MPIVKKPRQIRVDLDPDQGFPVAVFLESTQHVEEGGVKIADMPPHVDNLPPDSPQVVVVFGQVASDATTALMMYQEEVQRLAGELSAAQSENASLRAQLQAQ